MVLILILVLSNVILTADCTLSKSDKKDKTKKKTTQVSQDLVANVIDRNLVVKNFKPSEILREHERYCELEKEVRHFKGAVLAYVTPWNSKGYDIAKLFHKKFTHVSPVWLQVKPKQGKYFIAGTHDIDSKWIANVTRGGENFIVPRVLFDGWNYNDYKAMFDSEDLINKCAKTITSFIKVSEMPYDLVKLYGDSLGTLLRTSSQEFSGVTLELWSQVQPMYQLQSGMTHFLIHLSDQLHAADKILILVIPPIGVSSKRGAGFTKANFDELKDSIDYFSVMTYDYQNQVGAAAPISPLDWIEDTITDYVPDFDVEDRKKLLLGLNFYGMKWNVNGEASHILGHEFIQVLKNQSPKVSWQETGGEHTYEYKDPKTGEGVLVFYPSLYSLQERLNLARRLGTGISIWEIGQGLDYFYDLL